MNARVAKEEMALLMPSSLSHYTDEPRLSDETSEVSQPSLLNRIAAVFAWVVDFPRRRAVLAELNELSDHELADIGLNRSELSRVFEPEFAASRVQGRASVGSTALA